MADWRRERDGEKWHWAWRGWRSPPFAFLEDRAWTPCVIEDKLCFVASNIDHDAPNDDSKTFDRAKWCVVWGDETGPWFDDVSGVCAYRGRPIYIARSGIASYFLVWNQQASQPFDHQIRFIIDDKSVTIQKFDPEGSTAVSPTAPVWHPL